MTAALDDLQRAVQTLMCTDDYTVAEQGGDYAVLHYVHNSPPHPRIVIRVEQPAEPAAEPWCTQHGALRRLCACNTEPTGDRP